ncbi:MAG: serine dehydrogenasease [Acidimicrobiia bacterium]|nr:serine dehydrogenasease [Acidimicrobiia bacterium]
MSETADISTPSTPQDSVREWAKTRLLAIEGMLEADGLAIISPMHEGVEHHVKSALEGRGKRRDTLFVVLDTLGGVVEVVERIVRVLRKHYAEVKFIIPNRAMSAGTVLAMSGDEIWMDYHSCLGPIDPQLPREGRMVPALSYLAQYEKLIEKSEQGTLSTAELVLLEKLDLAELHQFELARDLSVDLLKRWLTRYKFKDWTVTETNQIPVTITMKEQRAEDIARQLSDHTRWLTHARGIDMRTLRDELRLKIDDLDDNPALKESVWDYYWFLQSYIGNGGSFVHAPDYF